MQVITILGQKLTQTEPHIYEGMLDDIDFVITKKSDYFKVDIFDNLIYNNEQARLESQTVDSLEQAVDLIVNY